MITMSSLMPPNHNHLLKTERHCTILIFEQNTSLNPSLSNWDMPCYEMHKSLHSGHNIVWHCMKSDATDVSILILMNELHVYPIYKAVEPIPIFHQFIAITNSCNYNVIAVNRCLLNDCHKANILLPSSPPPTQWFQCHQLSPLAFKMGCYIW